MTHKKYTALMLALIFGWLIGDMVKVESNHYETMNLLNRIESRIQDVSLDVEILQLDDIEIFENLRAIEQDSFYSNE